MCIKLSGNTTPRLFVTSTMQRRAVAIYHWDSLKKVV
jgi:hypothetical protein